MGTREPIGSPHGRRPEAGKRKLKFVGPRQPAPPGPPPVAEAEKVKMPAAVRRNVLAREFWRTHADLLAGLGRLRPEHRATFAELCLVHARAEKYCQAIETEGEILEGPRGGKMRHPLLTPLRQAETLFSQLAGKFGLDPISALRLPAPVRQRSRRETLLDWEALVK